MSKPIFVIRYDKHTTIDKDSLSILLHDYHLIFIHQNVTQILFECYNPDNIPESEIETIKSLCGKQTEPVSKSTDLSTPAG